MRCTIIGWRLENVEKKDGQSDSDVRVRNLGAQGYCQDEEKHNGSQSSPSDLSPDNERRARSGFRLFFVEGHGPFSIAFEVSIVGRVTGQVIVVSQKTIGVFVESRLASDTGGDASPDC